MKWTIILISIILLLPLAYAQDEEEAGSVGPEDGWLHAFDVVSDNIRAFLSRIGPEETHANTVRRIVAERRAEQRRLLTLKESGEITGEEYAKMVTAVQKQIDKKEEEQQKAEQAAQQKRTEKEARASERAKGKNS